MIDLLGKDLSTALNILSAEGIKWKVIETFPYNKEAVEGFLKVIKQEYSDNTYILTVCKVPDAYR